MAAGCGLVPAPDRFSTSVISFLDCQAQSLGSQGYQALAAPGSSVALLLTVMLTILIALTGYRMLVGETPTMRELVFTFVKIGVVLAFTTSWPAYQTVIYDVVLREPASLAAEIGRPAGLPGAAGDLAARLDAVDQGFRTLAIYGVGAPISDPRGLVRPQEIAPPPFIGYDGFALEAARTLFLVTALAAFAFARLGAGLLLALGPLFFAFLLFEVTRGLFQGWVRALIGLTLSALATTIVLGVELALIEPWLSELLRLRATGGSIAGVTTPLLATIIVFALVLAALLWLTSRLGLTIGAQSLSARFGTGRAMERASQLSAVSRASAVDAASPARSRALAISDSIATTVRREEQTSRSGARAVAGADRNLISGRSSAGMADRAHEGTGGTQRRTAVRVSKSARTRDRRL